MVDKSMVDKSMVDKTMDKKILIMIHGRAGAGKTTMARMIKTYLEKEYNKRVFKHSFAENLKNVVEIIGGLKLGSISLKPSLKGTFNHLLNMTNGRACQVFGDILRKQFGDEIFTRGLFMKWGREVKTSSECWVIDDLRMAHELNWINNGWTERDGVKIILIKIKPIFGRRLKDGRDPNHSSEIPLEDKNFDIIYQNDYKVETMEKFVKKLFEEFI